MTRRIDTATQITLPEQPAPAPGAALASRTDPQAAATPRVSVDGTKATIRIYGAITAYSWWGSDNVSSKDVAKALDALDDTVTEIQVRINSCGGAAFEGITILNALRAHPATITAVVDGVACSAASVIAVGCDETIVSPGAQLMIHNPTAGAWGEIEDFEKCIRMLTSLGTSMAQLYADASGVGTAADWQTLMDAETWYTADEAVAAGLADQVAVVPDAGKTITAGADDDELKLEDDDLVMQLAQLGYRYAGRDQAPAPVLPGQMAGQLAPAAAASRQTARSKPPTASAGGPTHTEGGSAVAFSDAQLTTMRDTLQLPADADEAAIVTAVSAVVEDSLAERSPAATAAVPEGHVVVPAARLNDLETAAQQGVQAARTLHERDREAFLDANRSKFLPANRDSWAAEYDRDPEATRAHFEKAADLIPVNEVGHELEPDGSGEDIKSTAEFKAWEV